MMMMMMMIRRQSSTTLYNVALQWSFKELSLWMTDAAVGRGGEHLHDARSARLLVALPCFANCVIDHRVVPSTRRYRQ